MPKASYERIGAAAVLTIERPERRNAIDPETADQLLDGISAFEGDDGARVLVLTGSGDEAFCAGADLKSLSEAASDPESPSSGSPSGPTARSASPGSPPPSQRSPRSRAGASPADWSWRSGATCGSAPRARSSAFPSAAGESR